MFNKYYLIVSLLCISTLSQATAYASFQPALTRMASHPEISHATAAALSLGVGYAAYRACKEETWHATWQRLRWLVATAILGGAGAALINNVATLHKTPRELRDVRPFYVNPFSAISLLTQSFFGLPANVNQSAQK